MDKSVESSIKEIEEFIEKLANLFKIDKNQLTTFFSNYNNNKYMIINQIKPLIDELFKIDQDLQTFVKEGLIDKYHYNITDEWTAMNMELSKLQILSLLTKKANCDDVIKQLTNILKQKVEKVNEILEANLKDQTGGTNSNDIYIYKYTKYKNKYISFKQKLNNNY